MQLRPIPKSLRRAFDSSSNANRERGYLTGRSARFKIALLLAGSLLQLTQPYAAPAQGTRTTGDLASAQSDNVVVQWNKTLLMIVRTKGAQPATIHPTRSFAIMHAAIYDAVNAIDQTHEPYAAGVPHASQSASQEAAAAAAAHEVLVQLYPAFQATLDAEIQQFLSQ